MQDLSLYCVTANYTIREALNQIEENRNRAVLVLDDSGRVCGLLSQGDIIRALASGADMFTPVEQFAAPSFVYLKSRNMKKAFDLLKSRGMTIFPVLDDEFRLIDILTIYDVLEHLENEMRHE